MAQLPPCPATANAPQHLLTVHCEHMAQLTLSTADQATPPALVYADCKPHMKSRCDLHSHNIDKLILCSSRSGSCDSIDMKEHVQQGNVGSTSRPNRDPLSHRIIEKRRRDRMNNCLANLSKLIPPAYLRKGRGRIEKTEIIEMAIKHMHALSAQLAQRSIIKHGGAPATSTCSTTEKCCNTEMTSTMVDEIVRLARSAGQLADNQSAACRDAFTHGYAEAVRCVASTPNMDETQRTLVLRHMQNNVVKRFGTIPLNDNQQASTPQMPQAEPLNMSLKRRKLDSGNACTTASAEPVSSNCSTPSEALSSPSTVVDETPASTSSGDSREIPAFALHSGGTYYVPVTVQSQALDESARQNVLAKAVDVACYPVTISVNFSATSAVKTEVSTAASTMPAHSGEKCKMQAYRQRHTAASRRTNAVDDTWLPASKSSLNLRRTHA